MSQTKDYSFNCFNEKNSDKNELFNSLYVSFNMKLAIQMTVEERFLNNTLGSVFRC